MTFDNSLEWFRKNKQIIVFTLFATYCLALIALNTVNLFQYNFNGDEGFTIRLSKISVQDMLEATAGDVHPPLYYFLSMGLYRVLGDAVWVWHLSAFIPYLIEFILCITVINKKFGMMVSSLMVTFVSLMTYAMYFNSEARMYTLASLFVLLAYYCVYLILSENRGYFLFMLFSLGAAYTHYYAMFSVAVLYLLLVVFAFTRKISKLGVIGVYIGTVIGYLPWLISLFTTFKRTAGDFWLTGYPNIINSIVWVFYSENKIYKYLMCIMFGVLFIVVLGKSIGAISVSGDNRVSVSINKPNKRFTTNDIWLLSGVATTVGTVIIGYLICLLIRPAYLQRYLFPSTVVVWLAFCVLISRIDTQIVRNSIFTIVLSLTLIVCLGEFYQTNKANREDNQNCRETLAFMQDNIQPDEKIFTNDEYLGWTLLSYYAPNNEYASINVVEDVDLSGTFESKWLILDHYLSYEEIMYFIDNGIVIDETYDGKLGWNEVYLYRLIRAK